jgi:ribosomal protein S18 acetylase RimI-like enzyme
VTVELGGSDGEGLREVLEALASWQVDDASLQFHPGDLGWFWRFGAEATAAAVRTWSRAGHLLAVGFLDSPTVLRLALAPQARDDDDLARALVEDVVDVGHGVLAEGRVSLEVPAGARVREALADRGWKGDEAWTSLRRSLADPVEDPGVRIEVVSADRVEERVAVQRASFDSSTFTVERWQTMHDAPAYRGARCLVAYDDRDAPVAAVTVWSAGPGRPGLLEPLGVHRDHRGRGFGRAISLGAAAALRELGSSCAQVCTPSANVGAVATYRSAGFALLSETRDISGDRSA